ncbi:asialoglycoprotein receptor 2-like [Suncus etruscus]|uniref:asialoglycoprotein receptor 2-like n=1 Tax=Suncus etruscus TaxID=109475 RepID=UPI00210F4967|nr:asialoglycoprotein receptor 2-like [Suncus etruscus]
MHKELQDIQQLDLEENDQELGAGELPSTPGGPARRKTPFWKGISPPQSSLWQRLCSSHSFSLIILGFNIVLLVAICVIISRRAHLQVELRTLKEKCGNFSSGILMELKSLSSHGGSKENKVTSLEDKLEKQLKELKADHSALSIHLKHFPVDLHTLACQMAFFRSKGKECCPVNWIENKGSCYWFSHTGGNWSEAESYCQLEKAYLVVINSREEQKFLEPHTQSFNNWIGLTDSDGSWKWVDGTDYKSNYKNWARLEPNNWKGREVDAYEDCAEIRWDGLWNDDICSQKKRWVCEMKTNFTI